MKKLGKPTRIAISLFGALFFICMTCVCMNTVDTEQLVQQRREPVPFASCLCVIGLLTCVVVAIEHIVRHDNPDKKKNPT